MLVEQLFIESESDHTPIEILIQSELSKNQRPKQSGVIIAHPYGPLGGNMDNNVVIRLHKHFCAKGYVSVCLNFRGCGRSKGKTSWTGLPERDDYLSVVNYLLDSNKYRSSSFPMITDLILCGYSFGAMVANTISCTKVPSRHILISMPLGVTWFLAAWKSGFFKQPPIQPQPEKTLCIYGDRDQFTGKTRMETWCKSITGVCINGGDHFWINRETSLIMHINDWMAQFNYEEQ